MCSVVLMHASHPCTDYSIEVFNNKEVEQTDNSSSLSFFTSLNSNDDYNDDEDVVMKCCLYNNYTTLLYRNISLLK